MKGKYITVQCRERAEGKGVTFSISLGRMTLTPRVCDDDRPENFETHIRSLMFFKMFVSLMRSPVAT